MHVLLLHLRNAETHQQVMGPHHDGVPSCDAQHPPCPRELLPSSPKPRAAELVVRRMQQFKRAHPKRLRHASNRGSQEATPEEDIPEQPGEEPTAVPDSRLPAADSNSAVACAPQQELGQEQTAHHSGSQENRELFCCQICQKNLSTMSVVHREQHVNRCLDEAEKVVIPSAPPVPECPICGKPCFTPKSRLSHLKQCAVKMEVGPQLLLQAVRRQAAQPEGTHVPETLACSSHEEGLKRKGAPSKEPRKRRKVGHEPPSEDLLVAMALSRSEMEQETVPASWASSASPELWLLSTLEKRGRKKKGPVSPPRLLVQDPETTGRQLEDRVGQLLAEEAEVASTPPLPTSRILGERGTASWCLQPPAGKTNFLWEGSALAQGWPPDDYYSARLYPYLRPQRPAQASTPPWPSSSHPAETPSPSASQREQQALQDLVELAREGLGSSQGPCSGRPASSGGATGEHWASGRLPLTGFVLPSAEPLDQDGRAVDTLGRLLADFRAMVNNPHLSDVQFQMDNGDVLYAHQFVLYARCPVLMQYVNREGFLAMEDGDLRVQRVLLSDVSTEATLTFLHYLYAADAGPVPEVAADLSSLAHRFGVRELLPLCPGVPAVADAEGEQQEEQEGRARRAENFQELLRSMWAGEEEDTEDVAEPEAREEDRENVDDADMDEIYEFAATQRKLLREGAAMEAKDGAPAREHSRDRVLLPEPAESPERARGKSPSIDLTQSKASPGPQGSPSPASRDAEVILLLDSDEELELEQTKLKSEGRRLLESSPKSCELFSIIDVDADPEGAQTSPARETEPPQEDPWRDRGTPPLFHDPPESSPETDRESSWLVPATPLASASRDHSSQTQISGHGSRTLTEPVAQPRAPVQERVRPKAMKKSPEMVHQARSPAHHCPVTPGSPESQRQVPRSTGRPLPRCSPASPHPDSWHRPDLPPHFQSPKCSPTGMASEVVEVEDSEEEEAGAAHQARSSPLLDGDPPLPPDCCWNTEPLSPIPIDDLNLERTGPLSASSPDGRARAAPDSVAGCSPAQLSTTPIRGSCSGPRGSPGSSRLSFLNSSLWDDWDGEEQKSAELPVLAGTPTRNPSANRAQRSRGFQTPKGANQKNLPPKVPITPMPRYSIMETPVLKKELDRFGVRPLPKRQMVLKLKEIFQYTHQTLESDSDSSGQLPQSPLEAPSSRACATESAATSVGSSDTSFSSHSSSWEFGTTFESAGEEEEGEDEVSASQVAVQTAAMETAVSHFIRSRPALYRKVLQYQPLELAELQAQLKEHGVRVAAGKLLDFLDAHCITFTTAAARKEKIRRKGQRPGSKSKGRRGKRPPAPSAPLASGSP
ncbi:structure-specific endonuclease subunit SLX4 [Sorex fumeus]|uniref:structure-specific endonuclease subunit SLX4 n=1 Tax=Sorex fumeus TaxID=62283 RepID=UPI0024AE0EAF|nr:structure-specific endonuclease subunit SLX4 [Sorex fumeus]